MTEFSYKVLLHPNYTKSAYNGTHALLFEPQIFQARTPQCEARLTSDIIVLQIKDATFAEILHGNPEAALYVARACKDTMTIPYEPSPAEVNAIAEEIIAASRRCAHAYSGMLHYPYDYTPASQ